VMLADALRRVLADTFVMYVHAHGAHWNITGDGFPQYHSFLGDLYGELWGALDGVAEEMRAINVTAPATLPAIYAASKIPDKDPGSAWNNIRAQLANENAVLIAGLGEAFAAATEVNNQGVCNFLADRLDKHAKHGWMLNASR